MERDNNNDDDDDRKMPALPSTTSFCPSTSSSSSSSQQKQPKFSMLFSLPDDQYQQVLSHMNLPDLMNLSLTSRHMRQLVNTTRHLDTIAPSSSSSSALSLGKDLKCSANPDFSNVGLSEEDDGAIPPSNTAEYSMTALQSSLSTAIATTAAAAASGGASNNNVAAAARLLLEPAGTPAADHGGLSTLRDIFRDSYAAAYHPAATENNNNISPFNNIHRKDDSAIIHQILYGTTIMTQRRLITILNRFQHLTDLTIRGLSAMGDSFLPILNNSAAAPNLIQLRLFDCRIVQNKSGVGLNLQQDDDDNDNNKSKLQVMVLTGTVFISYKKTLKTFVSSPKLKHVTMRGCRSLNNDDFQDITTRLTQLQTLHLPDCSDINQPVGYSTSIRHLSFMGCIRLQSLQEICMPNLVELDLSFNPLIQEEGIECLFMRNRGGDGNDGDGRASAPLLRKLKLRGCDGLQNPRINSSSLEVLDVSLCGGLRGVELNCDKLKSLEIGMCLALQSLSIDSSHIETLNLSMLPLKSLYLDCSSLKDLKLGGCFAMHDKGIECCKCSILQSIDIRGTNLTQQVFQNQSSISPLQTFFPPPEMEVSAGEEAKAAETYRRMEEEAAEQEAKKKAKTTTMSVEVHMGGQPPLNWHQMDHR